MNLKTRAAVVVAMLACLTGCGRDDAVPPPVAAGFVLPAGDAEIGKATFVELRCFDCHRVPGVTLPPGEEWSQAVVSLGGEGGSVETYNDLVTSIINPSHRLPPGYSEQLVARDGVSNMTNYNDVLTVTQLVHLAAFLQSHFELESPAGFEYPQYDYE